MSDEWFEGALRPERVIEELTQVIPEVVDGRRVLLRCRVSRIRSMPDEDSWRAVYELDHRHASTGEEQTVTARGTLTRADVGLSGTAPEVPFGADGWTCVLPALHLRLVAVGVDAALPGLTLITDPAQARVLLEETLRSSGHLPENVRITRCTPSVLSHKLGGRATTLCRLEYGGGSAGPAAVVVKVYHDDEGQHAYESGMALAASLGTDEQVLLARPLAYLPDLRLSVHEYLEHRCSLKELFHEAFESGSGEHWDELVDAIRATASGIAAVHRCGCDVGERVTWDDELAKVRKKDEKLTSVLPVLRGRTAAMLGRLESAAEGQVADPLGPAHHSFKPAGVLLQGDRGVSFIDFDNFCQAEPASDLAVFTSKLRHMALNKVKTAAPDHRRERQVSELVAAFLDEYQRHSPVSEERLALWEALELFSLVLSAAKKMNADWIDTCERILRQQLDAHDM